MLGFSTISELSTGEIPILPEIPNLVVQIFSDISVVKVEPLSTAELTLGYDADEWKIIYYGGNRNTWTLPLETTINTTFNQKFDFIENSLLEKQASDVLQIVYNYPQDNILLEKADESITSTSLNASDTYELKLDGITDEIPSWLISDKTELSVEPLTLNWNIFLNIDDPVALSIEAVQKIKEDDVPSPSWNTRPGLPISPISYNSIGIDLFDGGFTSFPDASTAELQIQGDELSLSKRSFSTLGELDLTDTSIQSIAYTFIDSGTLGKLGITSTEITIDVESEGTLELRGVDQVITVYSIVTNTIIEIEPLDNITQALNDLNVGYIEFDAKTYNQGYTLLQQIFADDIVELKIVAEGDGSKTVVAPQQKITKQIWIG